MHEHSPVNVNITIAHVSVYHFHIGGKMDFTRLNAAAAKNTSIADLLGSIFDAIAAAIRDAAGNQAKLDQLATQLESDNVREDLRVNALKDLVTPPPPALSATWNGPNVATVGTAFAGSAIAAGGKAPYSFALASGSLPDGVNLASDGTASGTPGTAGEFNFTGSVTDASGSTASWSGTISVS